MLLSLAHEAGPFLTGRSEAQRLRESVLGIVQRDGEAVVDLEGVEVISPSFADEFFAKMPEELLDSKQVRFEHLTDEFSLIVHTVVAQRRPA